MIITTQILTFAASAQQVTAPTTGVQGSCRTVRIEPLRTNTHAMWVGTSAVTNDASGTGVVSQLAKPGADTVIMDRFQDEDQNGLNRIDPTQYYAHGTSGEKALVTIIQS